MLDLFIETDAGAETGSMSEAELVKALSIGYGTNSAEYRNGRALVPEDCETTMINAMREQKEDCKMMNKVKKRPVTSTVHEYNRRLDSGEYEFATTDEGGGSIDTDQEVERVNRQIKYIQIRRAVTDQARLVNAFEDVWESEKLMGTLTALKAAERLFFHGDSDVIPTEWDGIPKQIMKSKDPNIKDCRGKTIGTIGDEVITDMTLQIYERGGDANNLFFPPVLGLDIQELVKDRVRFGTNDRSMTPVMDSYPTPYGTVKFGEDEGPDKFFRVKGIVKENGNAQMRPGAPTVTATAAAASGGMTSRFLAADAGNYNYTVFAVNKHGISTGTALAAAVAVAAGNAVTLSITQNADKPGTGYIICRSAKGGTIVMELCRIGVHKSSNVTTFVDLNEDLPGTASMLFLTEKKLQTIVEFDQLVPLRLRPLYESNKAETPFFIQLFGAADTKVPEWCGIVKNIAYKGGLYAA
jgi:hypothetical protein